MKIPNAVHQARPWVIERIAPDFDLLDVWALPIEGERDDLDAALGLMESFDPTASDSKITRVLWAVRLLIGRVLGWDDATERLPIPGCTETTLSARLPEELRGSADASALDAKVQRIAGGFVPLYRTDDEWAAEISNATVHGVLHLTWVDEGAGRYRAHMGVYVKPRGALGAVYLKFIDPFRHLIVYPALMRQIERAWEARKVRT